MTSSETTEIEAKFLISDLPALRKRAIQRGGQIQKPRRFERNLRFDTPGGDLRRKRSVLRLREDDAARLTYKRRLEDFEHREEIEFTVGDASRARLFLEALGYGVFFIYEKYREVLAFGGCELMLDDLPFGSFLEIEGPDVEAIAACAASLKLTWENRMSRSYMKTFFALKEHFQFDADHATFEAFQPFKPVDRAEWRAWLGHPESEAQP